MRPPPRKLVGTSHGVTDGRTSELVQRGTAADQKAREDMARPPTSSEVWAAGGKIVHSEDGEVLGVILYPAPETE